MNRRSFLLYSSASGAILAGSSQGLSAMATSTAKRAENADPYAVDGRYFFLRAWRGAIGMPDDAYKAVIDSSGAFVTEFHNKYDAIKTIFQDRPKTNYVRIWPDIADGSVVVSQTMHSAKAPVATTLKQSGDVEIKEQMFVAEPGDWSASDDVARLVSKTSQPDRRRYVIMTEYRNAGKKPARISPVLYIDGTLPLLKRQAARSEFQASPNTQCSINRRIVGFRDFNVPKSMPTLPDQNFQFEVDINYKRLIRSVATIEELVLQPGETARWVMTIDRNGHVAAPLDWSNAEGLRDKAIAWWEGATDLPYGTISVPDPMIQRVIDTAIRELHQMRYVIEGKPAYYFGPGIYNDFWILDGWFVTEALHLLGRSRLASAYVDYSLRHQTENGLIQCIDMHWGETGMALINLFRHSRLLRSKAWLTERWDVVVRAVNAIHTLRTTGPSADPAAPNYRLAPVGYGDGGIDNQPSFLNDYYLTGALKDAASAARWLGHTAEAEAWSADYKEYSGALINAIRRSIKVDGKGNRYIPSTMHVEDEPDPAAPIIANGIVTAPSARKVPPPRGEWSFMHAVWPLELFDKDDPLMLGTLAMLADNEVNGGIPGSVGWVDVWHQVASFYGHIHLWLGNGEKAAELLYAFANHASPFNNFSEESYLSPPYEWEGDMPHVSASAEFLRLTGHLLACDRGTELHLLEGMPISWVRAGMTTRVTGMGTVFGPLNMAISVADDAKTATIKIDPLADPNCTGIVIHSNTIGRKGAKPLGPFSSRRSHEISIDLQ